jgi:hypothetical protein
MPQVYPRLVLLRADVYSEPLSSGYRPYITIPTMTGTELQCMESHGCSRDVPWWQLIGRCCGVTYLLSVNRDNHPEEIMEEITEDKVELRNGLHPRICY